MTRRYHESRFPGEPHWRRGVTLRRETMPPEIAPWLFDAGSLTKRLKRACPGQFKVRVLDQRWTRPLRSERAALGLGDRQVAWVRQVHLLCGERTVVYARTVLPRPVLRGRHRRLACLGGRPLGEQLFRDRSMRRGRIEVAKIDANELLYHVAVPEKLAKATQLWGRRTVFRLRGLPLLVSEIFVPPPPQERGNRLRNL
ncbi:MAG: chorismate lyase [Gammaproteobacteria bacterium]|nr:chorismate lyase [Gammaproteobacteria bacterium]